MRFEWDEAKNQAGSGPRPVVTSIDRRTDYGEDRYISIGWVAPAVLIVVAHAERDDLIRLISARPASRKERQAYHEWIR